MSLRREQISRLKREPSRSRFHVALALAGALLLAGCSNHYGFGITELPAEHGWQPLPIESWVLNDGVSAKAMAFCPRATCTEQGFAALITLEGREADAMEKTLATDPARLARDFARPASKEASKTAKTSKTAKPAKPTAPKSTTTVSRFSEDGVQGLLVEIRARDASGKRAVTAILSGRDGSRLKLALGVSPDPDAARSQARAAWRDR
ncbi:hypothetical protein [Bosea psychrotolerans]|uniref:Uncharacterized protein n=1 Tax=Bosea psychrotolerans TaxID=1871628 RepID=A0A2S4LU69_9HYPH|nr:hypothetical protein [Bosea psychrotolerans]POR46011.1 hypothetical protein CYD53_12858 [Bosea psychrotolerans]